MTTSIPSKTTVSYEAIKLGIDSHAKYYWVSRQVDGAPPQPVQKMTYDELLLFVVKQQRLTGKVVTCYEAGAFGFQKPTDHIIGHIVQPALQVLQSFIRHSLHSQRRSQHLCPVEEIAFHRGLV